MSQYDFGVIDPQSKTGTDLANDLNNWRDALNSQHWGASRPSYVRAGMLWVDSSAAPVCALRLFDGAADLTVFTFNTSTHALTLNIPASGVSFQPSGTVQATNVQTAIEELGNEKAALSGATFTGTVKVKPGAGDGILSAENGVDGRSVSLTRGSGVSDGLYAVNSDGSWGGWLLRADRNATTGVVENLILANTQTPLFIDTNVTVGNFGKGYLFDDDSGFYSDSPDVVKLKLNSGLAAIFDGGAITTSGLKLYAKGMNQGLVWSDAGIITESSGNTAAVGFHAAGAANAASLQFIAANTSFQFYNSTGTAFAGVYAGSPAPEATGNEVTTAAWVRMILGGVAHNHDEAHTADYFRFRIGGLLIQGGYVPNPGSGASYLIPYSARPFLFVSRQGAAEPGAAVIETNTTAGFTCDSCKGSGNKSDIYWLAIGAA